MDIDYMFDDEDRAISLRQPSAVEKQVPVAYRVETGYEHPFYWYSDTLPTRGKWSALYTDPQPCPACEERKTTALNYISLTFEFEQLQSKYKKLKAERAKSESAWESLDNERVQYMNEVGDVLGQNNTDESLIGAAKRAMQTIEFQKKAWSADFVRMTRMEAAIERMRTAGGKDEFQKAFDDAKALL